MRKPNIHLIEVVDDRELRKKEALAAAAVKRYFPNSGPLRLYLGRDSGREPTQSERTRRDAL
jgi:hypothetical protein